MMATKWAVIKSANAFATTDSGPTSHFRVPTLVIHGTADKTVPIDVTGRVVAAQVPGAQLIKYDGSPHGVFATDTDRLAKDLVGFFSVN